MKNKNVKAKICLIYYFIFLCSCSSIVIPINPELPPNVSSYAMVQSQLDGGYAPTVFGRLYISYKEEYSSNSLKYKVYNKQNQVVLTNTTQPISIIAGESRFNLNVSGLVNGTDYFILEITNSKNENFYLRFK